MKRFNFFIILTLLFALAGCKSDKWISLFDGATLNGWQPSENVNSWKVEDGAIVTSGPRSHLFYAGDVNNHNFKNFELMATVKSLPGSNSGIYIHTEFQQEGWPSKGYECQVNNSNLNTDPNAYVEHKLTGSLYAIRNVWKAPVRDNEWFNYHIVVQGKTIRIYINDELMVDYTEPENTFRTEDMKGRLLSSGTFALQCHDPGSTVYYKDIKVKILSDDLPTPGTPQDDQVFEAKLIELAANNIPLVDLHAHLKGGLTAEQALENARKYGFSYGFAVNCGLKMGFETDSALQVFIKNYKKPTSTWIAMQAEGREWLDLFSKETIDQFDYVFTDAMTWTNDNGKRMRLWIKEETEVGDPQKFMEQLVDRIVKILNNEPIDIYVNPTYLPDEIAGMYNELWTPERMDRVIKALADNKVALEINAGRKLPSPEFIKRAKAAGVKFTFGTNNAGANDLGRLEYCIDMAKECGLTSTDIWLP
jgi:3-keto-disaccharide hydrolase